MPVSLSIKCWQLKKKKLTLKSWINRFEYLGKKKLNLEIPGNRKFFFFFLEIRKGKKLNRKRKRMKR